MTRAEYDAMPGLNFSLGKELLRSPAHYQAALSAKRVETEEDRKRFLVGTALHSVVLEGKSLSALYVEKPDGMSFVTKEGKAWRAEQVLPIIDRDTAQQVTAMALAIEAHPLAKAILDRSPHRELALQADIDGVLCKGLVDALGMDANGTGIIVDLKSTQDCRADKFRRKVEWDYGYDLQCSLYKELARNCDHGDCEALWIVQETTPPYAVMVYQPGPDLIASGKRKLEQMLATYRECSASGIWPGYQAVPAIQEL